MGAGAGHTHDGLIYRILVDECLTPKLVAVAKSRGHDATHITYLGKSGVGDWNIVAVVLEADYVLVTNNARDFIHLFGKLDLHPGLIIILPQVGRAEQVRLFEAALDQAEAMPDLVNQLLEVDASGEVRVRELSCLGEQGKSGAQP